MSHYALHGGPGSRAARRLEHLARIGAMDLRHTPISESRATHTSSVPDLLGIETAAELVIPRKGGGLTLVKCPE
ncbi:MAG: hypothetical protein FJ148_24140 [Deltaproteobacteria bacterium]|nr:hypothetical protein [Deltaproteobacteria bacterium]